MLPRCRCPFGSKPGAFCRARRDKKKLWLPFLQSRKAQPATGRQRTLFDHRVPPYLSFFSRANRFLIGVKKRDDSPLCFRGAVASAVDLHGGSIFCRFWHCFPSITVLWTFFLIANNAARWEETIGIKISNMKFLTKIRDGPPLPLLFDRFAGLFEVQNTNRIKWFLESSFY